MKHIEKFLGNKELWELLARNNFVFGKSCTSCGEKVKISVCIVKEEYTASNIILNILMIVGALFGSRFVWTQKTITYQNFCQDCFMSLNRFERSQIFNNMQKNTMSRSCKSCNIKMVSGRLGIRNYGWICPFCFHDGSKEEQEKDLYLIIDGDWKKITPEHLIKIYEEFDLDSNIDAEEEIQEIMESIDENGFYVFDFAYHDNEENVKVLRDMNKFINHELKIKSKIIKGYKLFDK